MTGMINLLNLDLPEKFWKAQNIPFGTVSRVSSFRHVDMPTNLWGKDSTFLLSCYFSVKSRIAASNPNAATTACSKGKNCLQNSQTQKFPRRHYWQRQIQCFFSFHEGTPLQNVLRNVGCTKVLLVFCCFFLFLYVCTTPPRCIRAFSVPAWLERISVVVDVVYLWDGMGKIIPGSLGNKEEMNVRTTHCSQQAAGYTYIV